MQQTAIHRDAAARRPHAAAPAIGATPFASFASHGIPPRRDRHPIR